MQTAPPPDELASLRAEVARLRDENARLHAARNGGNPADQELLKAVLENVEAGIVACDAQGVLTLFNRATREFHNLPEEPIPAEQWAEHYNLMHSDGQTRMRMEDVPLFRALKDGSVEQADMVIVPKGGNPPRRLVASGRAMRSTDGALLGAVVAMHDVTALKQTQEKLEEKVKERTRELERSEQRYQAFIRQSTEGVWRFELDEGIPVSLPADEQVRLAYERGYLAECNDAMARMYGLSSAAEITGRRLSEFFDPADPYLRECAVSGYQLSDWETREKDISGQEHIFLNSLVGIVEDGILVRAWGTQRDITARKHTEEALAQRQREFEALVENSPDVVARYSRGRQCLYVNRAIERVSGLPPAHFIGRTLNAAGVPEETLQIVRPAFEKAFETGEEQQVEFPLTGADGSRQLHHSRIVPERNAAGVVETVLAITEDVTSRKRAEQLLRRNNEDLQQFAFAAAHDLQEPLRTVHTYTQLLARRLAEKLTLEEQQFMRYVIDGARRMSELIQDLREYLEVSGPGEGESSPVRLEAAFEKAKENLRIGLRESGGEVTAGRLPTVLGKEVHFVQLFQNLISNALKYRDDNKLPKIRISAETGAGEWVISVQDNGIGIAPEHREQIFGIFKRLHGNSVPGTGIGLAICQKVAERYGGRIWVESEPGLGSTFRFTLPPIGGNR